MTSTRQQSVLLSIRKHPVCETTLVQAAPKRTGYHPASPSCLGTRSMLLSCCKFFRLVRVLRQSRAKSDVPAQMNPAKTNEVSAATATRHFRSLRYGRQRSKSLSRVSTDG